MKSQEACDLAYHLLDERAAGLDLACVAPNPDGTIAYDPDGKPRFARVGGAFHDPDAEGCDDLWYLSDPVLAADAAEESSGVATEIDLFKGLFLRAPAGLAANLSLAWITPTGHRVYYFNLSRDLLDEVNAWAKKVDVSTSAMPTQDGWMVEVTFPREPSGLRGWWAYADQCEPAARPWEWWPDWLKAEMRARGFRE